MNKFAISVGIVAARSMDCCLRGGYLVDRNTVDGPQHIEARDNKILWNGKLFDSLLFSPVDSSSSFELSDVVIGVGFHWQRTETQRFEGALRLVVEDGLVRAINDIDIERYLVSVISSEMSGDSPLQLLKAHAIVSRSWLIRQIQDRGKNTASLMIHSDDEIVKWFDREDHDGFDVCADDHCQRYQGITRATNPLVEQAVSETSGIVLKSDADGTVCDARFSKCCGGVTELYESCWEPISHPYLVALRDSAHGGDLPDLTREDEAERWITSRPDSFCNTRDASVLKTVLNNYDRETPDFYRWNVEYSAEQLSELVKRRSGIDFGRLKRLEPVRRGPSGRIVSLLITGEKRSVTVGKELMIRRWLSESHLYSSAFVVEHCDEDSMGYPRRFILKGAGWGHGVGMCQIGAAMMAVKGYDYISILRHYFPATTLSTL